MARLIDKDALLAEIERRQKEEVFYNEDGSFTSCGDQIHYSTLESLKNLINSIEVKEVDTWHLQEKENIYDAVKDWSLHTFACVMKDGTIQKFTGILDEDYEGHINAHIVGANDDYDNVDDIVKWIEFT